jgi:ariadne-1
MNSTDLIPKMKGIISEICEILNVNTTIALQLLRRYDWNKESLIETYTSNAEITQKKAGDNAKSHCHPLEIKASNCSLRHNDVKSDGIMMKDFLTSNYGWRCCPGTDCNRVAVLSHNVQFTDIGGNEVRASVSCDDCNASFCIKCGKEPHAPVTCHYLSKWKERCKVPPHSEGTYGKWVFTEKRPCPICRKWIERKQGHSHVTCEQCKYELCWLCMNPWHGHGTKKRICRLSFVPIFPSMMSTGMSDQEFYIHCHSRFNSHDHSQKVAEEFKRKVEHKLGKDNSQKDFLVLNDGTKLLVKSRLFLKYSFAFAYYHFDSFETIRRDNFEHHQQILETFTENLQEMTEKPLNEINGKDVMNQVNTFMFNYCTSRNFS